MMSPALWAQAPMAVVPATGGIIGGGVLGLDANNLTARLSIHPDDIARAAMALCLDAESAVIAALQQDETP